MSNAEKQKRYRARKKAREGEQYLKNEVQRVKKYYVPTSELSTRSLSNRRRRIKECMRKHRRECKDSTEPIQVQNQENELQRTLTISDNEYGPWDSTSDVQSSSPTQNMQLVVKLNFPNKSRDSERKWMKVKVVSKANKRSPTRNKKCQNFNRKMCG